MKIDANVKLGHSYKGFFSDPENYIMKMKKYQINKSIIIGQKTLCYDVIKSNDYIEQLLNKYPNHFVGAVRIDPWKRELALEELNKRFKHSNFKAIYLNPWEENFQTNDEVVFPIYQKATELDVPVIIEAGYAWVSHITQIGDVARRFRKIKILATNAGQIDLSGYSLTDVKYFIEKYNNIYLGTSSAVAVEWLSNLVQDIAPERIVFETNYPFTGVHLENYRIEKCYIESNDKERVFYSNAKKLFKI